jgi:carbonic anhydrase
VILSCSDSRVPPEVAFDLGVGDLFVVREPGNTATPVVLGSIYYGVQVLKANLVVVMGHRRCGAVKAAFCPNPGVFPEIWNLIHPAVHKKGWATDQCPDSINQDQWDAVARDNVFNTTQKVKEDLMSRGITNPNVVPAYYDVENGEIKLPLLVKH